MKSTPGKTYHDVISYLNFLLSIRVNTITQYSLSTLLNGYFIQIVRLTFLSTHPVEGNCTTCRKPMIWQRVIIIRMCNTGLYKIFVFLAARIHTQKNSCDIICLLEVFGNTVVLICLLIFLPSKISWQHAGGLSQTLV